MSSGIAPLVARADVFVATIVVYEDSQIIAQEYKIRDCWNNRYFLSGIRAGTILDIKGLGKLKVMNIVDYDKDDEFLYFFELNINCRRIKEEIVLPTSTIDSSKWIDILKDDYIKTWG